MEYVAIKQIDHPLGSGVWAYLPGDSVPAANVKTYGYDQKHDGLGPYVKAVGADEAVEPDPPKTTSHRGSAKS